MTKKQRIFSAIQPSGELHIGNYLGAIKNFIELQDRYECSFFIADYHSITENCDPKEKPKQIFNLAKDMLAAFQAFSLKLIGKEFDPGKVTIAVQSQISEHTELAWIFNTITPMAFLERMTQYKDKALRQKQNVNVGLFDYPVLQAADILIYKAKFVPVGQDQVQHLELSKNIARFFNNKFGKTFPEPKPILTETPKIMSLTDPTKKMSKSHGLKSYIGINDEPEVIKKKLKKAVSATDIKDLINKGMISGGMTKLGQIISFDINIVGVKGSKEEIKRSALGFINLITLLNNFGTKKNKNYFENQIKNQDLKFSELKEALAQDISDYFAPFRAKRKELEAKPKYVKQVLAEGAEKARKIAKKTMKEVKEKIGLVI